MNEYVQEYISHMLIYIRNDMVEVMQYLPYGIIVMVVWMLLFHTKKSRSVSLFLGYIVIVVFITLFSREEGTRRSLDFTLFSTLGTWSRADAYLLENILLFVPIGSMLPFVWRKCRNLLYCLLSGSVLSVLIEGIQYFTKRGYTQLDDIIANTVGAIIGFLIVSVGRFIYTRVYRLFYKG